jgi:hypothetical protein
MYIKQKFILHFVFPISKNDRGNVQDIQLMSPARLDQFGEVIGQDMIYDVRCYNKDILKLPDLLKIRSGSQVEASLLLSTKKVQLKDGREFYQPYLTLKDLIVIKPKADVVQTD